MTLPVQLHDVHSDARSSFVRPAICLSSTTLRCMKKFESLFSFSKTFKFTELENITLATKMIMSVSSSAASFPGPVEPRHNKQEDHGQQRGLEVVAIHTGPSAEHPGSA